MEATVERLGTVSMDNKGIETRSPGDTTVAQWQDDNPDWMVISVHPVLSTGASGDAVAQFEVKIKHRKTAKVLSASGKDPATILALISEHF